MYYYIFIITNEGTDIKIKIRKADYSHCCIARNKKTRKKFMPVGEK